MKIKSIDFFTQRSILNILIPQRKHNKSIQLSVLTSDSYTYNFILTNNYEINPKNTIEFYKSNWDLLKNYLT